MKSCVKRICTIILLISILAAGSGCRKSPLLEQVIYTNEAPQVDVDNETKINDNDEMNTDEDEDLSSQEETDDAETERDWEEAEPEKGDEENETPADDETYDEHAADDDTEAEASPSPTENPDQQDDSSEEQGGGTDTNPTTDRVLRQIVDGNGELVDVPESVGTVTAVGEAAVIVQMLGGEGRLIASSSSFTQNGLTGSVFADEGFSAVGTLWSGEGKSALSDEKFQQLLALKPDVCFEISGQTTFTDSQLEALKAYDIYYVVLPKLNTSANIKSAVTVVGDVLGDKSGEGGINAPALAADYCSWYDGIIGQVAGRVQRFNYNDIDFDYDKYANRNEKTISSGASDGFYSLYISAWSDSTSYKIYSDTYITMEGSGVAIAPSGYSTSPLSYYMSLAGVVNTAAAYADQFELRNWYVNPLQASTRIIEFSGGSGVYTSENLTCLNVTSDSTTGTVYLGEKEYPAIIVRSQSIKNSIENDAASSKLWTNYGEVSSADGKVHGWGFADEIGQFVSTTIRGDYDIYVNPEGVGSWTDGSAEGVLETIWVSMHYYQAFTEDELKAEIADFYRTFYRCEISDGQIASILAGP